MERLRKKRGEYTTEPLEPDTQEIVEETRRRAGISDWDGPGGDLVIGRHTWKEYIRGMHEGWLGPLDMPKSLEGPTDSAAPAPQTASDASIPQIPADTSSPQTAFDALAPEASSNTPTPAIPATADDDGGAYPDKPAEPEKPKEEESKPKKKKQLPAYIATAEYQDAQISPNCPRALGPSTVVPFPHLLGFWNFPIRMYRFLNRRYVADDIGRQTAAAVLGAYRPYHAPGELAVTSSDDPFERPQWEQAGLLQADESEWHKSVRERKDDDERERRAK